MSPRRYDWMRAEDVRAMLPTLEAEGINIDWPLIMNLTMAQSVDDMYTSGVGARRDYAVWRGAVGSLDIIKTVRIVTYYVSSHLRIFLMTS
jgi:hypothetical protein